MEGKYQIQWNESQAMMELYKGKLTTRPDSHSGEGIFFTSKFLASLAIWSNSIVYTYRCGREDGFIKSHLIAYHTRLNDIGTMVVMKLENDTKRTTKEVLDMFAPMEEGFVKTLIPMKEMCPLGDPVARSQARRILRRLDEFKEITLTPINANEMVLGMIHHVKQP